MPRNSGLPPAEVGHWIGVWLMDWKYKHFNQEAIFKASHASLIDAARAVVAESLGGIEDTTDGFVARGFGALHAETATFRITPTPDGTKVAVELLVERAAMRGYMLVDVGGYYNGQIDKWFSAISQRLGGTQEQILVSKTTSSSKVQQGCLAGCLVYLIVGVCLVLLAIPLDRALFPQFSGPIQGPISIMASVIGVLAGVLAFTYVMYPDASASKFIRERLQRTQNKERQ
jgi:hypothetical protein